MTTIVYDHKNKQIAIDSRATAMGMIKTDSATKYLLKDSIMWFFCGNMGETNLLVNTFKELTTAPENIDVSAYFVEDGNVYTASSDNGIYRSSLIEYNDSAGSGSEFVIAALDMGKTAKEAVEYAMTKDFYSGGKVHVYDIEKGEFI